MESIKLLTKNIDMALDHYTRIRINMYQKWILDIQGVLSEVKK